MADVTLLGASYTDVPAVDLPQTGGGTARFYDGTPGNNIEYGIIDDDSALVGVGLVGDMVIE